MTESAYGLWPLVVLNTVLFAVFAASFFHPRTRRDWRATPTGTPPIPAPLRSHRASPARPAPTRGNVPAARPPMAAPAAAPNAAGAPLAARYRRGRVAGVRKAAG